MATSLLALSIILILMLILLFFALYYLISSSTILHKELDELKKEAINAKTDSEISLAYEHLKAISKKLWHKSFETKFIEIKTILETKNKYLNEEQYVYVIYDPLQEKVICVHSEEDMECEDCKSINEERKNAYFLEEYKMLIKNK